MNARKHIFACIAFNRAIDRARLTLETGLTEKALESFINRALCEFLFLSNGSSGGRSAAHEPRTRRMNKFPPCIAAERKER